MTDFEAMAETIKRAESIIRSTHGADDIANDLYALGCELGRDTYNGWTNYPTWAINLWLSNDQGLYEMTLDAVRDEYNDAPNCIQVRDEIWTLDQARRFNTADRLREFVEELPFMLEDVEALTTGFTADLYGWALGQVNWHEIAEAWLDTVTEELAQV